MRTIKLDLREEIVIKTPNESYVIRCVGLPNNYQLAIRSEKSFRESAAHIWAGVGQTVVESYQIVIGKMTPSTTRRLNANSVKVESI